LIIFNLYLSIIWPVPAQLCDMLFNIYHDRKTNNQRTRRLAGPPLYIAAVLFSASNGNKN